MPDTDTCPYLRGVTIPRRDDARLSDAARAGTWCVVDDQQPVTHIQDCEEFELPASISGLTLTSWPLCARCAAEAMHRDTGDRLKVRALAHIRAVKDRTGSTPPPTMIADLMRVFDDLQTHRRGWPRALRR